MSHWRRARAWAVAAWARALQSGTGQAFRDRDLWIAGVVSIATLLVLVLTATQGFVRDEGYYFRAAADYHRWFDGLWRNLWAGRWLDSFSDATLTRAFGYNTEHPGLVKILMGWTWKVFHDWLGWTSHATGYRLACMGMVAVGTGFLYLLGARLTSRRVGLLAVALLLACPRVFYHFHLACFDGPVAAATVFVVYAFWRSLSSRPWIVGAGIAWGVAVATKHNAVFLLPTLGIAWLAAKLHEVRITSRRRLSLPAVPWAFFSMVVVGPLLFYLTYPYGWHDPVGRIGDYYAYHLQHEHYPVDFFGTMYTEPPFPWSFPFVMSALTVPLMVLVPGVVGWGVWLWRAIGASLSSWRGHRSPTPAVDAWLVVVSVLVPPLIIALPSVPIFGGTKHWLPMMPFLCLLAAWVVFEAVDHSVMLLPRFRRVAAAVAVTAVLAFPVVETARTHPLGHTYYNELALGHGGAAALGMPRTFWGGDGRELLPVLNERAGAGASVFTDRMNYDDFRAYQRDGLLRSDLRFRADVRAADWALINHQREYQDNEYEIWALKGDQRPEAVVEFDGVPVVSLYRVR